MNQDDNIPRSDPYQVPIPPPPPQPFIIKAYVNGQRPTLVSDTCQTTRRSGVSAQQTQGGNVILYVTADATSSWTVDIQT